jgi:hypothetical protein
VFRLGTGVEVPEGRYQFASVRAVYLPATTGPLRASATIAVGSFFDGTRLSLASSHTWSPGRYFQLSGTWELNRTTFPDRQGLNATIVRVRPLLMINERLSVRGSAQYSSAADALVVNARVRYSPRDGNDLYIVYDHGVNTNRGAYEPMRPLTERQAIVLNYSHTVGIW